MFRMLLFAAGTVAVAAGAGLVAQDQPRWRGENLQYFPKDIPRQELLQRMREFSFALGVRCQYCHAGGDGVSFDGVVFASDEKPPKVQARAMLRMVQQLNTAVLPALPSRTTPPAGVSCVTCHRGQRIPTTLQDTLYHIARTSGADAAAEKYRELRRDELLTGGWDFGEWEMNELARRLAEADDSAAAIAMLRLNGEFNPGSASIEYQIGELHRQRGEIEAAIQRYRSALAKRPGHEMARQRLAELEKK